MKDVLSCTDEDIKRIQTFMNIHKEPETANLRRDLEALINRLLTGETYMERLKNWKYSPMQVGAAETEWRKACGK